MVFFYKKVSGTKIAKIFKVMAPVAAAAVIVGTNIPVARAAQSVIITSPTHGSQVKGIVSITATASTGVKGVQFKLGNTKIGTEDTTYPFSASWNTNGLVNMSHNLTAVARFSTTTVTSQVVTVNTYNPAVPGTVMVVGDSISQQAFDPDGDDIQTFTANAPASNLRTIHVKMGWAVPDVQQTVTNYSIFRWPERLIIALGTNDASTFFGADGWTTADEQNFRTLINTPHIDSCVVLVLPYAGAGAEASWAAEINEARTAISNLATERSRTIVADWGDVANDHPEYMDEDGIHLLTPFTTPTEDLIAASQGHLNPVDSAAAEARQEFYWSSAAQCSAL